MNKNKSKWYTEPSKRMAVILTATGATVVLSVILLLIILSGFKRTYFEDNIAEQQEYCEQLSGTLQYLYANDHTDEDVVEYLSQYTIASGSSWVFFIQNDTVLFAKNLSTTNALRELKDRSAFLESLEEQNAVITTEDFETDKTSYTVGMITDRSQFLSTGNITVYQVYIGMLFAVLLLIAAASVISLTGAWNKSDKIRNDLKEQLLIRNQEFEKLEQLAPTTSDDDQIAIHHHGKSNRYKQYKFKFYLNARHAIYIDGVLGAMHPHTWEITLHVIKMQNDFIQFTELEKQIETFMKQYQDQELNQIPPFDVINPTLENCCEYFKEQLSLILEKEGWLFLMMEMSETPSRSYVISMIEDD